MTFQLSNIELDAWVKMVNEEEPSNFAAVDGQRLPSSDDHQIDNKRSGNVHVRVEKSFKIIDHNDSTTDVRISSQHSENSLFFSLPPVNVRKSTSEIDQTIQSRSNVNDNNQKPKCSKKARFNSLLKESAKRPTVIGNIKSDTQGNRLNNSGLELINFNSLHTLDSISESDRAFNNNSDSSSESINARQSLLSGKPNPNSFSEISENSSNHNYSYDQENDYEWTNQDNLTDTHFSNNLPIKGTLVDSPSRDKSRRQQQQSTYVGRAVSKLKFFTTDLTNKILGSTIKPPYAQFNSDCQDNQDLLTGTTKYHNGLIDKRNNKRSQLHNSGRTFRGSYRYSRIGIVMAIFKKLFNFLGQRSTLALLGAFLIHVTLGTVYTLSNINSYLTSYMRKHGTPNATYGGSMWISSSYAVGQGLSMVLGGYLERRFSARLPCILGCILHSVSIMSTSKSIDHGHLAVLLTYGFLPGFGCGLAYMTPMSNGFGWFPNRRGLVAGVILAGFGIGTFVFNMAQTAFVNPENLSPLSKDGGYFTQDSILERVPQLFIFLGTIYASMQFIGCCLLFKPPTAYDLSSKSSDSRPILVESEPMSIREAILTREFIVLFLVFGITNQGVLFVNSMLKEYGQIFIDNDLFLAWTGSMASIANSLGRLTWGIAIDRFSFTQCFTAITTIFGALMFIMPFEFILSSKLLYLLCTLGIFGSFSGWMSTYPVHLSRVFGVQISGVVYGLIFVSQSIGGIFTAFGAHYLIDNYSRFVPFFCVTCLEVLGLAIYHIFYNK